MVKARDLAALERIARIKAEQELKKLAAFRTHILVAHDRVDASRAAIEQSYSATAPLSVSEARMANAQAGRAARELARAAQELRQMQPRFDAMRQVAGRAFGRAEALAQLHGRAVSNLRKHRNEASDQ